MYDSTFALFPTIPGLLPSFSSACCGAKLIENQNMQSNISAPRETTVPISFNPSCRRVFRLRLNETLGLCRARVPFSTSDGCLPPEAATTSASVHPSAGGNLAGASVVCLKNFLGPAVVPSCSARKANIANMEVRGRLQISTMWVEMTIQLADLVWAPSSL